MNLNLECTIFNKTIQMKICNYTGIYTEKIDYAIKRMLTTFHSHLDTTLEYDMTRLIVILYCIASIFKTVIDTISRLRCQEYKESCIVLKIT